MQNAIQIPFAKAALFLDVDGTLAHFADTPLDVRPEGARTALLRELRKALDGRIAAISGRSIDDIDRILEGALPHAAGVHGLQHRFDGGAVMTASPHPALSDAVTTFADIARAYPGSLIEMKPLSVALHYRQAPLAGPEVLESASAFALNAGLALQEGDMVVELLTPGRTKGDAVKDFMAERPFLGATPLFVGDDITDEAAFSVAQDYGGVGVVVGARKNTIAVARLPSVDAVIAWLSDSLRFGFFRLEAHHGSSDRDLESRQSAG